MQTRILIAAPGEDYVEIPLTDEPNLAMTYEMALIQDLAGRSSSYTKTATLSGSKEANKLFNYIFNIGIDGSFNTNKKAAVRVEVAGQLLFEGYLRLSSISDLIGGKKSYEVTMFANLAMLILALGDAELTDLDFSEFDHIYNKVNQWDSMHQKIQKDGADYTNIVSGQPDGSGYLYPMINYGDEYTDYFTKSPNNPGPYLGAWNVRQFFPAIYLKQYIDKIFEFAGFTYTSDFFDSDRFKRFFVPFNSDNFKYTDDEMAPLLFQASMTSDTVITEDILPQAVTAPFDDDSTFPNSDPGGVYDNTTYQWTVAKTGTYIINFAGYVTVVLNPASTTSIDRQSFAATAGILVLKGGTGTPIKSGGRVSGFDFPAVPFTINPGDESNPKDLSFTESVKLNEGDIVYIKLGIIGSTVAGSRFPGVGGTVDYVFHSGAFVNNTLKNESISENDTVLMNRAVPSGIKMADLLLSVVKSFNLYMPLDRDNPLNVPVQTRDEFYSGGITLDWTDKLDISQPLEITPMSELSGKDYLFTFKEDSDTLNKQYSDVRSDRRRRVIYGEQLREVDNDFFTNIQKYESLFSPTPSSDYENPTRILPTISFADDGHTSLPKTSNIRLLQYGGMRSCETWFHSSLDPATGYLQVNEARETYLYTGHLDDPINPTFDLNFGTPSMLFWNAGGCNYTNNNIYNAYWKSCIDQITDKDSKMVTAYFHLTPLDIANLDFRNKIFVDKHYYIVNRIVDYQPTKSELTQVELIKLKPGIPFSPTTHYINGGHIPPWPTPYHAPDKGGNTVPPGGQPAIVRGVDNNIGYSVAGAVVVGDQNRIGYSASNVTIIGSRNIVVGGRSNVTLINTNDTFVDESNVLYINGCKVDGCISPGTDIDDRSGTMEMDAASAVTVSITGLTTSAVIILTPVSADAPAGEIRVSSRAAGSFTISSTATESGLIISYFIAKF